MKKDALQNARDRHSEIQLSANLDITSGRQYRQTEVKRVIPAAWKYFSGMEKAGLCIIAYHGRYVFVL